MLAGTGSAAAQDGGGFTATVDVMQGLEHRTQDGVGATDGSSLKSLSMLGFGLRSETRSQSLGFSLSSGLEASLGDESDVSVETNRAALAYTRASRSTDLTFGALYRRDDIDDLVFDELIADDDIITGVGERQVLTVTTRLVVGLDSRVTGTFAQTYETSDFFDTPDPALNDSETQQWDARVSFQLSRVLTTNVFAGFSKEQEEGIDATDRETARIGTGASYAIDPTTTITGEVSYQEEESRGATIEQTDGLNYGLILTRARPDGAISLSYSQEEALTGTRRQLSAGRSMILNRGSLDYSLGVSKTDGFDPQVLASLSFEYQPDRNSSASISLGQEGTINGDDEEVVDSRLNMAYSREVSDVSQIGASLELVDENVLSSAGTDQRSVRLGLTYDYDLTRDWGLTSGYQYSVVRVDGEEDRTRSTVFIGLQRSFSFRP